MDKTSLTYSIDADVDNYAPLPPQKKFTVRVCQTIRTNIER